MKKFYTNNKTSIVSNSQKTIKIQLTLFLSFLFFLVATSKLSAAIVQRGTATTANTNGNSLTINKPTGVVAGDIMIVTIAQQGTNNLNNPTSTGWNLISAADLGGITDRRGIVMYRIAGGADPASYTFNLDNDSNGTVGTIIAFSGVDNTTPFDVGTAGISVQPSQNGVVATTRTTATANAAVIMLGMASNSSPTFSGWNTTSPGGLTELFDNQNGGRATVGGAWAIKATPGATGNGTANMNNNERNGGLLVILRAAAVTPTVTSFSPTSACVGTTPTVIITGTNFTGATAVSFNGTAATPFTINSATQITTTLPAGATTGPISVTNANGTGTSATNFTINPYPVVAPITGATPANVCVNSTIAFACATPGGVWGTSNAAVATVVGGTVTGVGAGTANITYTVTTSGCATVVQKSVNVNALPVVSGPTSVCIGSTIQMSPNTGGTWVSNNTAIATIDNTGLVTPVANGNVTFTFTDGTTLCTRTTASVAVNVAPSISVHPVSQLRCSGPSTTVSFSVTASGTGLTYLWYKNGNPMSNGGNISGALTQTLTISPIAPSDAADYHCIVSGTCTPAAISNLAALTINEMIVITSQPVATQTHCSGGTATFSVTATGTNPTFQWYKNGSPLSDIGNISGSLTQTLTITPLVLGDASANYYCIVSGVGPCSPVNSNTVALVVNEGPAITTEPALTQTVCAGGSVSLSVIASGGNLVYQWFRGGFPISNGGAISGATSSTLTINPTAPSDSAADYYCVVSNGCVSPVYSINAQITVNDRPFIQNYTTAICSTDFFNVAPTNGVPTVATIVPIGTTYTWSTPTVTGGITGGTGGVNQPTINGTLINPTNSDQTATYTVTPISGTSGTCTGAPFTVTVTVHPMPFAINSSPSTCSGVNLAYAPTNGGGNIVPAGTTYSWLAPTVSGGMTGGVSGTNQSVININLNNPTNTVQTASYNVTATSGSCVGSTFTVAVNVNPKPTAAGDIVTQSICSGANISAITISNPNSVAGTIYYSWTRNNTVNVTGIATSGSSSLISGNLTNTTNTPQTVTFLLYTSSDQGCLSDAFPVTVIVNPVPTVSASPASQPVCSGTAISTINFTSNGIAGTTFNWSRDNTVNLTGIAASGSGTSIAGTFVNNTNVPQTTTFTVMASANGCDSTTSTVTVTVNPRPDISVTPTAQTICGGVAFGQIDTTSPNGVSGTTFSWTRNNTVNLTGFANSGTGATIPSGTFQNNTNVDQTTTFTITATAGGCTSVVATSTVLVHPAPLVVATPASQNRCNNIAIANINLTTSNSLAGTTYSWTRDNTTNLTGIATSGSTASITGTLSNNSSVTQTTTFTIVATGPGPDFCTKTITATVTVYAPFVAPVIGDTQTACEFSTPAALTMTTLPLGGSGTFTYQWQRSANGTTGWANIGGATGQTYTPGGVTQTWYYRLIVTDTFGCAPSPVTSNTVLIQVVNNFGLTFTASGFPNTGICPGTTFTPSLSSVHGDDAAVRFTWSTNGTYLTPATGGPIGTTGARFWFIVWLRTSTGNFSFNAQNNTNASVSVPLSITPSIYDYNGTTLGAYQCSLTPQIHNITIYPTPIAYSDFPAPAICSGTGPNISITGNVTDANMTFTWTRSNASVGGATTGTSGSIGVGGTYTINNILTNNTGVDQTVTYMVTPISNGCSGTAIPVTITVAPAVTPGTVTASQTICSGDTPAGFNQTVAATGNNLTYQWQMSTNGGVTYTNIPGETGTTYAPGAITQTTYFIRVVSSTLNSFTCSIANTTPIIITVNAINPGSLAGSYTICSGGTPASALGSIATGSANATGSGAISYEWESSIVGCSGPWTVISGATLATYTPTGLTDTTYFRRKGKSTVGAVVCSSYSNCITVTVNKVTGGTVGSDQSLCGNNPDAFTETTASTGSGTLTYQWQISSNNVTFTNISGANGITYDPPAGVTAITYYIRITTSTLNSVACTAQSNTITVTPNTVTAGVISGNRTVCSGGDPAAFTVSVAATGTNITYQWQMSTTGGAGPWTDISGATNATYDENGPLAVTTYFQCMVTATLNGSPCSVATNFVTVFVNNVSAPVITGAQSVCGIQDPTVLTASATSTASGTLTYQWQRSTVDCNSGWANIPGANTTSYDPPVLTQTTYYQLLAISTLNSVVCSTPSNCVVVTVNSKMWNGLISSDWTNPANWSGASIPTSADCVVIPTAPNAATISGTNYDAFAYNITVLNGGILQINTSNNLTATDNINVQTTGQFLIKDSASLIQVNNTANVGRIDMERITKPMYRFDFTYWGSPVTLASNFTLGNAGGLSPGTLSDKFFSWTPSIANSFGGWTSETAATPMNPIKGYIVRAPQSFSFTPDVKVPYTAHFIGTPNNGDILCPIYHGTLGAGNNNDKYNLLGNPYPSAVDAEEFLSDPVNVPLLDGTIYFWTHNSPPATSYADPFYGDFVINYTATDYASWNKLGGTGTTQAAISGGATPSGFIAAGQGFFAKSTGTATSGNNAIFRNSMRLSGSNDQFFRTASSQSLEKHRIWLNLINNANGGLNQILVGYVEGATNDWDRDFDGTRISDTGMTLYSIIPDYNLVIQGRPLPFNAEDQVPLGFKVQADGNFSIRIDHIDGLFDNQNIYVEDKLLNVIHNLKANPYSFTSATGTFNDRFVLRYTDNQLGITNPDITGQSIALILDEKLQIQASENIREVAVYDLAGKLLRTYQPGSLRKNFAVDFHFAEGIYMIKIKFENSSTVTEKLINRK